MGIWDWQVDAKCKDLSLDESERLFFTQTKLSLRRAQAYCSSCPVQELCLNAALSFDSIFIWAGTSEKERRKLTGLKRPRNSYPPLVPVPTQEELRLQELAKNWTERDLEDALKLVGELLEAL